MPVYEYRCRDCNEEFEKLVRFGSDGSEIECPRCHSKHVEKKLSLFSSRSGGRGAASFRKATTCAPSG